MGMFDQMRPFSEHFKEGDVFELVGAKMGPEVETTDYGRRQTVWLKIKTDAEPQGGVYSIIGDGIVSQVERMDRGDLPARVALVKVPTRSGNNTVKLLIPASELANYTVEDRNGVTVYVPNDANDIPF